MDKNSFSFKIISSMEKCFCDDNLSEKKQLKEISCLKNEKISFQIAYTTSEPLEPQRCSIKAQGELSDYITINQVVNVPSTMPVLNNRYDSDYLRTKPGVFPDIIMPLHYNNHFSVVTDTLLSLWIDLELPEDVISGEYDIIFNIYGGDDSPIGKASIKIEVIDALLPESRYFHTEWLHTDCIAETYNVEVLSDEYYRLVENYISCAAENGINIILTPVFTPALDTYIGGERLTCQLVEIKRENGVYSFDFSHLDRWISICKKCGIKYFEIPPFFTQWGAKSAPKIMGFDNGEYKKLFGWETDALNNSYREFLTEFIPALIKRLKYHSIDKNTFFHISDEPELKDKEHYRKISDLIRPLLLGYNIIDACQNPELFEKDKFSVPVVSINKVERFRKAGFNNIWVYYCGGHTLDVTNRFLAISGARTRILGIQMYADDAKGFLHWGFNFFYNRYSYDLINPYIDTCGEYFFPSGDTTLVYPAKDGKPYPSIRLKLMRDAFQDLRAMQLCEEIFGRDYVLNLISDNGRINVDYMNYPKDEEYILKLRKTINDAIKLRLKR